ncbi:MAG: FAD-binding protein [Acidobacteria bacterium]|nr:MAG: FAD-binding protein [Acidobacteriota bacterium]
MLRIHQLRLPLDHDESQLEAAVRRRLGLDGGRRLTVQVARRNWDARGRRVQLVYSVDVDLGNQALERELLARHQGDAEIVPRPEERYVPPHGCRVEAGPHRPIVVGAGPCGFLAALALAEAGLRPIVLERGQPVRQRTRDTFGFWRGRAFDPESNVQFGEGGAGTFSDGKLYSQVRDPRHLGRKVLEEFVEAGAPEEILWLGRPHVGTFRLVKMVESLRAKIEHLGGEFRFASKVVDLEIETSGGSGGGRRLRGARLEDGSELRTDHLVLAVGHSARDTFELLQRRGVHLVPKPFSIGLRIEHPQAMIDRWRFGRHAGHPRLGSADYRLVHHASNGRSVYSFCMCPGGTVVAAASEVGGVVTNGLSQYQRAERNANAGIVVGIEPADFADPAGPDDLGGALAGIDLQRRLERAAFEAGGGDYDAPAQRLDDFLAGRPSRRLGDVEPSYRPGVRLTDLGPLLPDWATGAIREALQAFERKVPGFTRPDALLTGVESRTSSPLRIERSEEDLQSVGTAGLFPAGEGAGYAGGILSAAIDGLRVAEAVVRDHQARLGAAARVARP